MPSENQTQTQTQTTENVNFENVKAFEKKYNATLSKEKVVEIIYRPKWNLKELVEEAKEYASVTGKVVRILGIYSLGFGKSISVTITPSGFVRFTVMLGFRVGLNRPNALDITVEELPVLKMLIEQLEKVIEQLQG
jgi:hypothetical protein